MSTLVERLRLRNGRPNDLGLGALCDEAAAEIDRLTDLAEANAADAARYRWLREQAWYSGPLAVVRNPKQAVKLGHDVPSLFRLDEAIDAEMAQQAQEPTPARYTLNGAELTAKSRTVVIDGPTSFVSRHRY